MLVDGLLTAIPEFVPPPPAADFAPTTRDILAAASTAFKIPIRHLIGPCKRRPLVYYRQVTMWVMRHKTTASYPRIAFVLGNRDHTTIISGVRNADRLFSDAEDERWYLARDNLLAAIPAATAERVSRNETCKNDISRRIA